MTQQEITKCLRQTCYIALIEGDVCTKMLLTRDKVQIGELTEKQYALIKSNYSMIQIDSATPPRRMFIVT